MALVYQDEEGLAPMEDPYLTYERKRRGFGGPPPLEEPRAGSGDAFARVVRDAASKVSKVALPAAMTEVQNGAPIPVAQVLDSQGEAVIERRGDELRDGGATPPSLPFSGSVAPATSEVREMLPQADSDLQLRKAFVESGQYWAGRRKEQAAAELREIRAKEQLRRLNAEAALLDMSRNPVDELRIRYEANRRDRQRVERELAEASRGHADARRSAGQAAEEFHRNKTVLLAQKQELRAEPREAAQATTSTRISHPAAPAGPQRSYKQELDSVRDLYAALHGEVERFRWQRAAMREMQDAGKVRDTQPRRAEAFEHATRNNAQRQRSLFMNGVQGPAAMKLSGQFMAAAAKPEVEAIESKRVETLLEDWRRMDFDRHRHNSATLSNGEVVVRPALAFDEAAWAREVNASAATPEAKKRAMANRLAIRDELGVDLYDALLESESFKEWMLGTRDTVRGRARKLVPGRRGQPDFETASEAELVERFRKSAPESVQRGMQLASGASSGFHGIGKGFWGMLHFLGLSDGEFAQISSDAQARAARVAEGLGGATWLNKVTAGVVGLAPTLASGGLFQSAGRVARMGQQAVSKESMRRVLAAQGSQSVGSTYVEAKEAGYGSWEARWLAVLNAAPEALITAAFGKTGAEAIVAQGTSKRGFLNGLKSMAIAAGKETPEELLVTLAQAPIQKVIDPDYKVGPAVFDTLTTTPFLGGGVQGVSNLSHGNLQNQLRSMVQEMREDFRSHGTEPVELSAADADAKQLHPSTWYRATLGGKLEYIPDRIPQEYNREVLGIATNEELYHAADNDSLRKEYDEYERLGGTESAQGFLTGKARDIIRELKTTDEGKQLILDSLNAYKGSVGPKPGFEGDQGIKKGIAAMKPSGFVAELARQIVQFRARGEISEGVTYRVADKVHKWIRGATARIGEAAQRPESLSPSLAKAVERIEQKVRIELQKRGRH